MSGRWRLALCQIGIHARSSSVRYLGMAKGRRNWLGIKQYKSFLDRYRCPRCNREYERWS